MTEDISRPADSTSANSATAKIYTFPPRGRFALRMNGDESVANVQLPRGVKLVAGGSSWYHDAAIKEENNDERGGKN
jgi:Protein of unknown function (DUF2735)